MLAAGGIVTGSQAAAALAPLQMPLQTMLTASAQQRINRAAGSGKPGARDLATYFVGQGVGMMTARTTVRQVVDAVDLGLCPRVCRWATCCRTTGAVLRSQVKDGHRICLTVVSSVRRPY